MAGRKGEELKRVNEWSSKNLSNKNHFTTEQIITALSIDEIEEWLNNKPENEFTEELLNELERKLSKKSDKEEYWEIIAKYLSKFSVDDKKRESLANKMMKDKCGDLVIKYLDNFWLDPIKYINSIPLKCKSDQLCMIEVERYIEEHKSNLTWKLEKKVWKYCFECPWIFTGSVPIDLWIIACFDGLTPIEAIIYLIWFYQGEKILRWSWETIDKLYSWEPLFDLDWTKKIIKSWLWDLVALNPKYFTIDEEIISLLISKQVKWSYGYDVVTEYRTKFSFFLNDTVWSFVSKKSILNANSLIKSESNENNNEKLDDKKYRDAIKKRLEPYLESKHDSRWDFWFDQIFSKIFTEFVDDIDLDWLTYLVWFENWRTYLRNWGFYSHCKNLDLNLAVEKSLQEIWYNRQFDGILEYLKKDDKEKNKKLVMIYVDSLNWYNCRTSWDRERVGYVLKYFWLSSDTEVLHKLIDKGLFRIVLQNADWKFKDVVLDRSLMESWLDRTFGERGILDVWIQDDFQEYRSCFKWLENEMINKLIELWKWELALIVLEWSYNSIDEDVISKLKDAWYQKQVTNIQIRNSIKKSWKI